MLMAVLGILLIIPFSSYAEQKTLSSEVRNSGEGNKLQTRYYFSSVGPKTLFQVEITGSGCQNLVGTFSETKRKYTGLLDYLNPFRSWDEKSKGDQIQSEVWKNEGRISDKKIYCVPYIDNIKDSLNQSSVHVTSNSVIFNDGSFLVGYSEEATRKPQSASQVPTGSVAFIGQDFIEIKEVFSCAPAKEEYFCVRARIYIGHTGRRLDLTYRAIRWQDNKLLPSADKLQNSLLFQVKPGVFQSGIEYAFEGGYMIPESAFVLTDKLGSEISIRNRKNFQSILQLKREVK